MSTYDDASLVMIPSGYKTGTVFSQKPMSTDGQLTFTRSNDTATRVASNGLIEKVRTNILLHSQAFENAVYNKGTGGSVSANSVMAPDGTMTADAYTFASSTSEFAYLAQSVAGTSQIPNAFSIYIKRPAGSGSRTLRLAVSDVTISTTLSSNFTVTESWQRFEFARTSASTTGNVGIGLMTGSTGVSIAAGEVLDVWGAQLETGDIATDYIPTTTAAVSVGPVANVPRLDYLGSTCPRLLLEPSRTNLITFSEQFDNAGWNKAAASVTANNSVSPDGYTNADLITTTAVNGYVFPSNTNVFVAAAGATYSYSVYLKAGTASIISLLVSAAANYTAVFNLSTGVATTSTANTTASMSSVGNGWYRCVIVCASVANSAYSELQIGRGASGLTFSAYGAQLEAGAYATSYIPTLAASVTRGADVCVKTSISSLIGQTEGTVFIDAIVTNFSDAAQSFITISDGTINNRIELRKGSPANILLEGAASTGSFPNINLSSAPLGRYKIAVAYKTGDTALFINGLQIGSTSTNAFAFPSLANVVLGANFSGSTRFLNDSISQALLFKTRIPNSELASLTTL